MNSTKLAYLVPAALLVVATACGPTAGTTEKKSESTTQTAEGTVQTTNESTQVGTTLAATSETKVDTPSGTITSKTETIIGTITVFEAGKKLEVLTGEKKTHSYSLDDKDIVFAIEGAPAVGKNVTVVEQTGDDKIHRVSVTLN
ncbi:MAG: hypothetical protein IPN83_05605 [Holophagales bacterium]|nr:hypothetical protein [Holophagales bacterium]